MKRVLLFMAVLCGMTTVMAQDVEFTADRPGMSTGPDVVGHRVVQWEQGIAFECDDDYINFTFSNTLLRYGLFEGVELRLAGDGILYNSGRSTTCDPDIVAAFTGLNVGTKIRCFEGRGAIPAISLMANLLIPHTGGVDYITEHIAPSLYLLFDNRVTDWLNIGYNVGAEWDGSQPAPQAFVALCLGFTLSERVGCFVESYNYLARNNNSYGIDFGLNYMAGKRVQLDIATNMDVRNPASLWAVSLGVAWQINNPKTR